jgi:hypothetical protein
LAQRGVYATRATSIVLQVVAPLLPSHDKIQVHTLTVILLDSSGRRIGESAWYLEFKLRNRIFT